MINQEYIFDLDDLLQVLQAIKLGMKVECKAIGESEWRPFYPDEYDINTEEYRYRVKPGEYRETLGEDIIKPEDLQEGRVYFYVSKNILQRRGKASFV